MRGCLRERLLLLLFAAAQNPHSVATKRAVARRDNLVVSWLHPPAPFLVPCTIRERGFDGDQQAALIQAHNEYRSLVAKGELPGFQTAADMCETTWDPDLAAVAQSYVEQCAPQAKVPEARDFLEEGQNLCVQTLPGSGNDTGWEACVAAWFSEHTDCPKGIIGSYRNTSDRGEPSCEHFTQLVWSRSRYVGCGFALVQSSDGATRNLYACNYDEPGNQPGTAVYLTGPACSSCPRPEEKPRRRRRDVWSDVDAADVRNGDAGVHGRAVTSPVTTALKHEPSDRGVALRIVHARGHCYAMKSGGRFFALRSGNPHSVATKRAVAPRDNLVVSWLHPPAPFLVPCTIRERGFDGDQQAALVKAHNEYRSLVAKGELPGFQTAADMCETTWDSDLAALAQSYVEQCAPQANVPEARDFLEEGQNLCVQTLPGSGNDTGWEAWVAACRFSEHTDCPKGIIGSYRNTRDRGEPFCEHFTQLVWSRSRYVGCGFALVQSSDGATRNLYACNYDEPGNQPGTAVYLTGPPLLVLPQVHEVRYAAGLVPDRPAVHRAAR
ncbi:hypothetical protein MTO96_029711 [Rhipicephalus appendiculatus]